MLSGRHRFFKTLYQFSGKGFFVFKKFLVNGFEF